MAPVAAGRTGEAMERAGERVDGAPAARGVDLGLAGRGAGFQSRI
jgi:hypothetical protein